MEQKTEFTEKEIIAMSDLSRLRKIIDSLNREIVLTLSLRQQFPGNLHLYNPSLDVRLRNQGVDDISAARFLYQIYSKICNGEKDEKYLVDIAKADVLVQDKIEERVSLGRPVAVWKYYHTDSEQITYEKREQEVLNQVSALAKKYRIDEDNLRTVFSETIIPATKGLENCVMNNLRKRNGVKQDTLARTACEAIVPILISALKQKHGEDKQFKVEVLEENEVHYHCIRLVD